MVMKIQDNQSSRVAVLAVLSSLDPSYSIAGVVAAQLKLLVKHGHRPVFVTTSDFADHESLPEGVELRVYPRFTGEVLLDSATDSFMTYVAIVSNVLNDALKDCAVCLSHDVIFLTDFLPVNWAMRRAAEKLPSLRWLHWIHSAPSKRPQKLSYPLVGCYSGMPNSEIVYLNRTDVPQVADMFNIPESEVRIVENFIDVVHLFDLHPLTEEILSANRILEADVVCIYPMRTTPAKQPEKIIKLLAYVKTLGHSVRIIICNSYSNADSEKAYVAELEALGKSLQLEPHELLVTSSFTSAWCQENSRNIELGVPRKVILDLMRLSDIFILPSSSEACSVVMLEASLSKNLMVLNDDLFSLHEFGGQKVSAEASNRAVYFSFGSLTRPIASYNPSEEIWLLEHARTLMTLLAQNHSLQFFRYVRQRHSAEYIYHSQLKPLLRIP